MAWDVVVVVVGWHTLWWSKLAVNEVQLLASEVHVRHCVVDAVLFTEGHDAIVEAFHYAAFRGIELLIGPQVAAPIGTIEARVLLGVFRKFDGDDQGCKDNDLGANGVNVSLLLVVQLRGGRQSVTLG